MSNQVIDETSKKESRISDNNNIGVRSIGGPSGISGTGTSQSGFDGSELDDVLDDELSASK